MKTDVQVLTAAQARSLVERLGISEKLRLDGLQSLSLEVARALSRHIGLVSLKGLSSLSDEAARQLARLGGSLYLDGVTSLSASAALSLSRRKRNKLLRLSEKKIVLSLNGLATVSDGVAEALSRHKGGDLLLNGVTHLSDAALCSLFDHRGKLYLDGLSSLSDQAAEVLARRKGKVSLNGLTTVSERAVDTLADRNADWLDASEVTVLSPAIARALARAEKDGCLNLPRVTTLSKEAATQLAAEQYGVLLNGVAGLSVESATALAGINGRILCLDGLTAISAEVCRALAVYAGDLSLDGLESLDGDAAAELARHVGDLSLDGLSAMSDAAAEALSRHKGGRLSLRGLSSISQSTAESLARHEGDLDLAHLRDFTQAVADSLARHSGGSLTIYPSALTSAKLAARLVTQAQDILQLDSVTTLSEEAAAVISQFTGGLWLSSLATLSIETARALARHAGSLDLAGIKDLSAETAGTLSQHAGTLNLRGVTELSEATARALAPHEGELYLDGLTSLSEEAAKQLSLHQGILHLDGVETLTDEAATALASHRRRLTLLGLKKLSSTATAALDGHQIALPDTISRSVVSATRTVRVFISSTFRDFAVERDILVRRVFPELRRRCGQRQVTLIDVDLRWGITEEDSQQGAALPICLAEIDRARPFFIGMLGERYGWIPAIDQCDRSLLVEQPWLEEHLGGKSVTEIEIRHGVLNTPQNRGRAFFYFRDPAWALDRGPDFASECDEDAGKLLRLKNLIRSRGLVTLENYQDPEALADRVQEDLWAEIDRLYPDAVRDEDGCHRDYATRRSARYVDHERRVERLHDAWSENPSQPLVVSGPAGSGKTALLLAWLSSVQEKHADVVVLSHYLGCNADAADPSRLAVRLGRRIDAFVDDDLVRDTFLMEVLGASSDWREERGDVVIQTDAVSRWLLAAGEWAEEHGRRFIVALDGLDLLADAAHLQWMPRSLPSRVSLVMTARPGAACTAAKRSLNAREIATVTLTSSEKEELVEQYLRKYRKQLTSSQMQRLLDHPLSGSPFFLLTVADNLRTFGHHEKLDWWLSTLLSQSPGDEGRTVATCADVFQHVLARLEGELGHEGVRRALLSLWATRGGLAPDELFAVARVSPFVLAAIERVFGEAITRGRGGLMLTHPFPREAVEKRYMPTPHLKAEAHRRLADFFRTKPQDERVVRELLWHLHGCSDTEHLRACLLDQRTFRVLYPQYGAELTSYWSSLAVGIDASYESALDQWAGCRELLDHGPPNMEPSKVRVAVWRKLQECRGVLSISEQMVLGVMYPKKKPLVTGLSDSEGRRYPDFRSVHAEQFGIAEDLFQRFEETGMAKLWGEPTWAILMLADFLERAECLSGFTGRLDAWRARHREIWQYSEVEPALKRALAGQEKAHGTDHPDTWRLADWLARYQD